METNKNIGKWTANINNSGKTPEIRVMGTFPTNGEKPMYHLIKNDPQGINQSELLLTLVFGTLVDPKGTVEFSANYIENILSVNQYKTVLIVDENNRKLANIKL